MTIVRRPCAVVCSRSLVILAACSFVGCRQTSSEYVEAELRVQSRKVAELESRLLERDAEIETLRNTVTTFQAGHVKPAEAPESVYRDTALSRITLTLATGAKDADLDGKDDGVVVGVAPHDYDGDVFKCPGSCRLQLFETTPAGVRKPIGDWSVSAEQIRGLWRASLLGQGYHLTFGWQTPPREQKLRAVVTFRTVDGREFQAEKDFDVSLQPKSPPRLPGARIEEEKPLPVSPAPLNPPMTDLPKPRGLGALSQASSVLPPVRSLPPSAPKIALPEAPPSAAGSPKSMKTPPSPDPEHSPPPLLDRDRPGASPPVSPGDLADAQEVIILPPATSKPVSAPKPSATTAQPPMKPSLIPGKETAATDRLELPDEPAPPKSVSKPSASNPLSK